AQSSAADHHQKRFTMTVTTVGPTASGRRWWMRSPGGPLLAIVGVKVGLTLLTDNRYGYHRDELYYAVTAHHLAFGYVDFPPVTPVTARLAQAAFGSSLVGLRVPALAAGVGVVLLPAAIGLGMLTKFTPPALVGGICVGVLLTPIRRELRTPWPWLGAIVAVVIAAPNLAWQIAHGWPSVDFLRGQNARVRADNPTAKY